MYVLISTTRDDLEISESFHETKEAARQAMIDDIILLTDYESLDEIIEEADAGLCGFSDDDAWAETNQCGTGQWKIVEVPESTKTNPSTEHVQLSENTGYAQIHLNIPGKGYFDAMTCPDSEYPGIDVEFVSNDDHGERASRPRVVFEWPNDGNLRMLLWTNRDSEDYVEEFEFDENGNLI